MPATGKEMRVRGFLPARRGQHKILGVHEDPRPTLVVAADAHDHFLPGKRNRDRADRLRGQLRCLTDVMMIRSNDERRDAGNFRQRARQIVEHRRHPAAAGVARFVGDEGKMFHGRNECQFRNVGNNRAT